MAAKIRHWQLSLPIFTHGSNYQNNGMTESDVLVGPLLYGSACPFLSQRQLISGKTMRSPTASKATHSMALSRWLCDRLERAQKAVSVLCWIYKQTRISLRIFSSQPMSRRRQQTPRHGQACPSHTTCAGIRTLVVLLPAHIRLSVLDLHSHRLLSASKSSCTCQAVTWRGMRSQCDRYAILLRS